MMFPFDQSATWGWLASRLYMWVVARGQERQYARVLSAMQVSIRGEVLDVGMGPGHAATQMARQHPGARIWGVDSSREMVHMAQRRALHEHLTNLEFHQGDAMALPFTEERFDGVFSMASIKHWPDRIQGLRETYRVLKPGGWMTVLEADRGASTEVLKRFALNWPWLPPALFVQVFRRFVASSSLSRVQAEQLLHQAPFNQRGVEGVPDMPFWIMRAIKP